MNKISNQELYDRVTDYIYSGEVYKSFGDCIVDDCTDKKSFLGQVFTDDEIEEMEEKVGLNAGELWLEVLSKFEDETYAWLMEEIHDNIRPSLEPNPGKYYHCPCTGEVLGDLDELISDINRISKDKGVKVSNFKIH